MSDENGLKLAKRREKQENLVFDINNMRIGSNDLMIAAGPCSIESRDQIFKIAKFISKAGANVLRGGAFKMRTSPYSFQGLGKEGLSYLNEAGKAYGLTTISEVTSLNNLDLVTKYVDILQIGTRNMSNFELLRQVGLTNKPVLLKRGLSATYHELLMAAEYILCSGNSKVILCERGIRTHETYTRNTLDLNIIPALKELSYLPIIVDPSHGTGRRNLVPAMAKASIAAGADGVIIEVDFDPDATISDANQTIGFDDFELLVPILKKIRLLIE